MKKALLLFFLCITSTYGQILGCTDPLSKNYNPKTTENDGSCVYKSVKIKPEYSNKLSDSIKETSGLIAFDSLLWTHNDDHDETIYGLNHLGELKKKIALEKVINNDWEEISQNSTHIYIGDFGNNYTGNRSNLHILKIEKESFLAGKPIIDTISFTYSNQTNFAKENPNKTNFDCEAFIVTNDSIYLFIKPMRFLNQNFSKDKKGGFLIILFIIGLVFLLIIEANKNRDKISKTYDKTKTENNE